MLELKDGTNIDNQILMDTLYLEENEDGTKELGFNISTMSEIYPLLKIEETIKFDNLKYLVKEINEDDETTEIICLLDRDDFRKDIIEKFNSDSKTEKEIIAKILNGTGWTVSGTSNLKRKTIELEDATKLDILIETSNLFEFYLDFDNINKIVSFTYPETIPYKGLFLSEQVNLKKVSYNTDGHDLVTRIYGYGKTDEESDTTVNFASINGGMTYVENLSYKGKIVSKIIRDERFTDSLSLLNYCKKELEKCSVPIEAFEFEIINLAKFNEGEYYMYNFHVRDLVDYIDRKRNKRIRHRIVKYRTYPFNPENDKITLSNNPITLESIVNNTQTSIEDVNKKTESFLQEAIKEATNLINSFATKGHRYETENETYFLDKLPKESAKYVMRMNLGGIAFSQNGWAGPYISAWTIDGKFNASFITTGVLKAIRIEAAEIFGGTININNKFLVDEFGNLTATSGTFSGQLSGVSGEIGGFGISNNGFLKREETKLKKVYSDADTKRIRDIIIGTITPTNDDYRYYDLDGSGTITTRDYIIVQRLLSKIKSDILVIEVMINPKPFSIDEEKTSLNDPVIAIAYKGKTGVVAEETTIGTGSLIGGYGTFKNVTCKNTTTNSLTFVNENNDTTNNYIHPIDNVLCFGGDYKFLNNLDINNATIEFFLKMIKGSKLEFYLPDGNYVGNIQGNAVAGNGAVGIGFMADGGDNLLFGAGNVWKFIISGGGTYSHPLNAFGNLDMHGWNVVNSSDKRLKENIKDIDTSFIYDLELKSFDYINGNKDIIGILANDYVDKDYSKYFVTQGIDGLYSVNYQNINNALIQCVQEQNERIKRLEELVKELVEK